MSHANATLTPAGRLRLARLVVDKHWSYALAAERFSVSITTARRWATRYRELGKAGKVDRSSRPHRCPNRLPQHTERRIVSPWAVPGVVARDRVGSLGVVKPCALIDELVAADDLAHPCAIGCS